MAPCCMTSHSSRLYFIMTLWAAFLGRRAHTFVHHQSVTRSRISGLATSLRLALTSDDAAKASPQPPLAPIDEFAKLGVVPDLVLGLQEQSISVPTPVQRAVIPRLLAGENLVMAASTGSGKTLAFILPVMQKMATQEQQGGYIRQVRRPRCLVLVPTRELARQVLSTVKSLSHFAKISSCAVLGGEQYALQKKNLDKLVDMVVASPGRLAQHKEQGNVHLSQVDTVIIDEVDTMLMQGFGSDIRTILRSVMSGARRGTHSSISPDGGEIRTARPAVQLIMATATLTKAVKLLLTDVDGGFNIEFADPSNKTPRRPTGEDSRIEMKIVEVDGLHRALAHVRHIVEDVKGGDKLVSLGAVLQRHSLKPLRTLVFCNSVDAVRAVQYYLTEGGTPALSYHGDLNSREREANLASFRQGENQYLVCTDIAARGLDIPEIDHVVMFDFPLNPIDYLHRAGRCGRAGRKGMVTSLVAKRDKVLSDAVQGAIARGMPLDNLSSSARDYQQGVGKLAGVLGRKARERKTSPAPRVNRGYDEKGNRVKRPEDPYAAARAAGAAAAASAKQPRGGRPGGPKPLSIFARRKEDKEDKEEQPGRARALGGLGQSRSFESNSGAKRGGRR